MLPVHVHRNRGILTSLLAYTGTSSTRKTKERVTSSRKRYINSRLECRARGTKAFQISDLQAIVDNFYREIQIDSNSTIAFKGGHYERDLLASIRIPAVNLECFNCPKAEKIFDQLIRLETCGNHLESDAYQHCAKVEVEAFAMWLQQ